jgi:hypothetical protein
MDAEKQLTPSQRYYQSHKEQRKAYGREYYHKNRDKILQGLKDTKTSKPASDRPKLEKNLSSPIIDASGCFLVCFD